jgi:hypothetical protein
VHYLFIYFEVILGPTNLSFELFIEWRVSIKKFEKSKTIEKYMYLYNILGWSYFPSIHPTSSSRKKKMMEEEEDESDGSKLKKKKTSY